MADTSRFVAAFAISLFVSAFLISYFLMAAYGVNVDSGLSLPSSGGSYASYQNFASGEYNKNTFSQVGSGVWEYVAGQGMVLQSGEGYYLVDNIDMTSDIVTNEYVINNSAGGNYAIELYYSGGSDANQLVVRDDGFHITSTISVFSILGTDRDFIPYVWASRFSPVTITTTYNRKTHSASWVLNHNPTTTFSSTRLGIENDNILGLFPRTYGGVLSNTPGFTLVSFSSSNNLNTDTSVSNNPFTLLIALFKTMLLIIAWNVPPAYFPWELNILLVKTQAAALFIGLVGLFRGGA